MNSIAPGENTLGFITVSASALRTLANTIQKKYHTKENVEIYAQLVIDKKSRQSIEFYLKHEKGKARCLKKLL